MWEFILLSGKRIEIPPADIHILAAWHRVYEMLLGLDGKIGVLWTSSGGEMDLEPVEQEYLKRLNEDPRISFIWFGDPSLAQVYPKKGFYAPYPMDVDGYVNVNPHVEKKDIATLFCPTGPKKNILNQLLAMKLVQGSRKLTLHTNIHGYDNILEDMDHVCYEWLLDMEYRELLASAKINLACSWSETFNYNVAEAALLGTVSVISSTIPLPGMIVRNPNSPIHIAEQILHCVEGGSHEGDILEEVRAWLRLNNHECKRILAEKLSLISLP